LRTHNPTKRSTATPNYTQRMTGLNRTLQVH